MKIIRLRTAAVEIPFDTEIGVGYAALKSSGLILIFLETDQGLIGEGLVFSLNAQHLAVLGQLVTELEPFVVGLDPTLSGIFTQKTAASLRSFGTGGFAAMACAGIEEALLDLRAKAVGLNVSRLLGSCRTTIPAYNSGDLWVSLSIDQLQASAQRHLDAGFRAMKMRLTGRVETDLPRVRAVREVIGPSIQLMADANQKMTVADAIRLGRRLEEFELHWLEEPVYALDHAGEAAVARALDMPIATGESVYTSRGAMEILRHKGADVLMPDLQRMGGPSEFLKAAALAESFDIPVSGHLYPEMSVGLMAAIPNALILEYMDWVSRIYRERLEFNEQGHAIVPERPGWGFSFDPAVIDRYRLA
jgi:L-alanine-DL-glutamate epimerase-like enolase superfamily enzyme